MTFSWTPCPLATERQVFDVLAELRGKAWLCRGQSAIHPDLVPSIDRDRLKTLPRPEKLNLELQSIKLFQETAHFFSHQGEQLSLNDEVVALMVLRHYGVPTRLLDWSLSPHIAAYFSLCANEKEDGAIWTFDERLYEQEGKKQWERWKQTTSDLSGHPDKFRAQLTMFDNDPPDWFICGFYRPGFHRQNKQEGAYTLTARFGRSHADKIAELLGDPSRYQLYLIGHELKPAIRRVLFEKYGIWRGSLYPDSAGAAETARRVFREWVNSNS
jgi:hypothetical protein